MTAADFPAPALLTLSEIARIGRFLGNVRPGGAVISADADTLLAVFAAYRDAAGRTDDVARARRAKR